MKIFDVRILAPGVGSRVENLIKKRKEMVPLEKFIWIFRKPIAIEVFISSFVIGVAIAIKILMIDHIEIATNAIKIWFK
ncbi:Uncharacterised protein [Megamonas hypermegale]|uniref:Uncharacterized protein n=1 Tax=Megamonas hypermegale TaxID=158847 RepID=A0A378NTX4_9FIRM|nr:hypothetical protein [Megamonas hypermegale]STY71265.1 Uncharacterised protein [Megamonas hypermegale]